MVERESTSSQWHSCSSPFGASFWFSSDICQSCCSAQWLAWWWYYVVSCCLHRLTARAVRWLLLRSTHFGVHSTLKHCAGDFGCCQVKKCRFQGVVEQQIRETGGAAFAAAVVAAVADGRSLTSKTTCCLAYFEPPTLEKSASWLTHKKRRNWRTRQRT